MYTLLEILDVQDENMQYAASHIGVSAGLTALVRGHAFHASQVRSPHERVAHSVRCQTSYSACCYVIHTEYKLYAQGSDEEVSITRRSSCEGQQRQ